LAKNNIPKSAIFGDCTVVPTGKEVIEQNSHGFKEISSAFFARRIDPSQNIHRHFQPRGRFGLPHKLFGDGERMKNNALASPRDMRKQPVSDEIMFRAIRRIVGCAVSIPRRSPSFCKASLNTYRLLALLPAAIARQQHPAGISVNACSHAVPSNG